ncbi:hypothetical protein [Gimesia chilikensis]|uniref:DUF4878 domain-containing protein n=1 Tax=Gimesia chilikensis TaxID=2605989 RepID=A0A517PK00_9PLAN|nr:hypothetical protein [Gimesia chilikensis]QDT19661.1 hypothetical protein HG66A1_14290 [Gimesia chilikensis]
MKYWVLCLLICMTCGCGGSDAPQTTVEQDVFAEVTGLGDTYADEKMFQDAFVSGAAPQNREDYGKYAYVIDGEAEIDGDQATVPVKIIGGIVSSQEGDSAAKKKAGEKTETKMTWKLQREGEEWKLKEAPLPG